MRKEERIDLLIEHTHPDGTISQEERPYTVKVSYDAWLQSTRTNMLERKQEIVRIKRCGVVVWVRDPEPPQSPKSTPLF